MNQKFFKIKYISESNTVNNMKLMILANIRTILILFVLSDFGGCG